MVLDELRVLVKRVKYHPMDMIVCEIEKLEYLNKHAHYSKRLQKHNIDNPDVVDVIRVEKLVPLLCPQVKKGE